MEVSFSQRFQNVVSITNALIAAGVEASQARKTAQNEEESIHSTSESLEDYQRGISRMVDEAQEHLPAASAEEDGLLVDMIFNEQGPSFGTFVCATFHADGRTAEIFKAKDSDESAVEKVVALKVTTPSRLEPPHNSEREARILKSSRQESIVPLLDSFWQPGGQFILVFPFLRQDLENLLRSGTLTTTQSRMVFQCLFGALEHLHSQGIIHRDIKPSCILLKQTSGPAYLTDFGISWSPEDPESEKPDRKITDVGTTCYRPPELLFGYRAYDTSLDMWAAGCVIAEVVRRGHEQIFDAGPLGSELALIKSIFTTLGTPTDETWPSARTYSDWGKVRFQDFPGRPWDEVLSGVSSTAIDFVKKTICIESSERLTAGEAKKHPLAMSISVQ